LGSTRAATSSCPISGERGLTDDAVAAGLSDSCGSQRVRAATRPSCDTMSSPTGDARHRSLATASSDHGEGIRNVGGTSPGPDAAVARSDASQRATPPAKRHALEQKGNAMTKRSNHAQAADRFAARVQKFSAELAERAAVVRGLEEKGN